MTNVEMQALTVLVVDDDDLSQSVLEGVLRNIGCKTILLADDANTALHLAKTHQPDFVTLDIYMPDVDGWALLKQLRQASPKTRIIMVTGSNLPIDFEKSMDARADGYCIKPVLPDLMKKAMRNALSRHK